MPHLESVKANLILDGFAQADLKPSIFVSALRDQKKNHFSSLSKISITIKDHVNSTLHLLFLKKIPSEIWAILENQFQHISLIRIASALTDGCIKKVSKFKNVVDYISSYQIFLNKIVSLINKGLYIDMEIVKIMLQANILCNLRSEYSTLVSTIQRK